MWTLLVPLVVVLGGALFFAHFNALSCFTHDPDRED